MTATAAPRPMANRSWATLITTVVAIGIGVAAGQLAVRPKTPASKRIAEAFPPATDGQHGLRAFILVSPGDCAGTLEFISLFQRDTSRLRLQQLFLVAHPSDLLASSANLRSRNIHTPLQLASPAVRRAATSLGNKGTPFVILLDENGVVRLAAHAPPDVDAYMAFPDLLRAVVAQGTFNPLLPR